MPNINNYERKIVVGIIVLFIVLTIAPGVAHTVADEEIVQSSVKTATFSQEFSSPLTEENEQYVNIIVKEADSRITNPGEPKVPVFTKTFEFPLGTRITDVKCMISDVKSMGAPKKVEPASSVKRLYDSDFMIEKKGNPFIYNSINSYPFGWFSYKKGSGINKDGDHVLYLSIHVYPVRYMPAEDVIEYIDEIQIAITYKETGSASFESNNNTYDLVIITPSEYSDNLLPLVNHKNKHGVKTNLTILEDIYASFPGRDEAEQIKYFIKHAIEDWDIKYVLLVGDIKKLPIRATYAFPWGDSEGGNILSDLYYADIYDANYSFCNWDANENNIFGEVEYNESGFPPKMTDFDAVDLYPDVHLGRLACSNNKEVDIVVDKIITYEENTYDQIWFKKIILAGGDTFPLAKGAPPFIYEGEITNTKVAQQLPDFKHIILWASKHNLNAITFNMAVSRGAGFVSYAGHGVEHGWGTYRPNAIINKRMIFYFTPFIRGLRNYDKLPIIFFDACLTARLDFNMSVLGNYFPKMVRLISILKGGYDPSEQLPCFAWSFINKADIGAIATIGATRSAYTLVDKNGVYAGAGYLDVHFFKAYNEGVTAGEMLTAAQNDYLNNVGKDYFTIEEFLLLGDPSLMVGGYP